MRPRVGVRRKGTRTKTLARIFYCLWTKGGEYHDPGVDSYEQQYQKRILKNLQKRADELGFTLIPQSSEVEFVS